MGDCCSMPGAPARSYLLQWHITDRCNIRCHHCYQDSYADTDLPYDRLIGIFDQFRAFLDEKSARPAAARGHINITGGEPFVRADFLDLLGHIAEHRERIGVGILTNGTMVGRTLARELRRLAVRFVQVSIDGTPATHDRIRGRGSFARAAAGITELVRARVRTFVSFTAHRGNYLEYPAVVKLARRWGAAMVWTDRFIPEGIGRQIDDQVLTREETRAFMSMIAKERRAAAWRLWSPTRVAAHRALQFLQTNDSTYHCTAGDTLITVMPTGEVLPCRRMPIPVGNLHDARLGELYESNLFRRLRDRDQVSEGCTDCSHQTSCRGGLKCLSYAVYGDPFKADPGCWLTPSLERPAEGRDGSVRVALPVLT